MLILKNSLCILHCSTSFKNIIVCSLVIAYVNTGYLDHIHFSYLLFTSFWSPPHAINDWALFALPLHPLFCNHWVQSVLPYVKEHHHSQAHGQPIRSHIAKENWASSHQPWSAKSSSVRNRVCVSSPGSTSVKTSPFLCCWHIASGQHITLYSPKQIVCDRFTLKFQASLAPTSSFCLLAPSLHSL